MNLYPAVDIKNGRAVRLLQGRPDQETVYYDNPAEPAKLWAEAGSKWIHVVDLNGAFTGKPDNWDAIEKIAATGMKVEMGGGMRTIADVERAFLAGVSRVVIGTKAVSDEAFLKSLLDKFGDKIAVGIDAKDGKVAVKGWVDTTETSAHDLAVKVSEMGVKYIIYTDISTDGMMQGPNFAAQEAMLKISKARVIASGGVSSHEDVHQFAKLAARYSNFEGVIIGKALYEGRIDLTKLHQELAGSTGA